MRTRCWPAALRRFALGMALLGAAGWITAEKLPIKTYTIADGLALDQVNAIRQDSRHLLWFATSDGLSWFDGYEFTTYTTGDGLPHPKVNDFLQTRAGDYWLATNDGLCRFIHQPRQASGGLFEVFRPDAAHHRANMVYRILEDPDGSLWCGTDDGLFRFSRSGGKAAFQKVALPGPEYPSLGPAIMDLVLDNGGTLWIATSDCLCRRWPDGRMTKCWQSRRAEFFWSLAADRQGRLWVGTADGLYHLSLKSQPGPPDSSQCATVTAGLPDNAISCLLVTVGGQVWAGTQQGLAVLEARTFDGPMKFRAYTVINGLSDRRINALGEDDDGNLWVGTEHGGVMKISRTGFSTFDEADGLNGKRVESVFTDQAGGVGFLIWPEPVAFTVTDGRRFTTVPLPGTENLRWVGWQSVQQDVGGEWWLATGDQGLWRYPKSPSFAGLAGRQPARRYTTREGLPADTVFSVFEDSRGDIWLGIGFCAQHLARWDRRRDRFVTLDAPDLPVFFAEDRSGGIWIGFFGTGLWRYRQGRITPFTTADGLPAGNILHIFEDQSGRLWISSSQGGAVCIPDPAAEHPHLIPYTMKDGLNSNQIRFVIEDRWNRLYFGTTRGIDRLDPATGAIGHFTTADGLAANYQDVALRDRDGSIWFGTFLGISRFKPEAPPVRRAPVIWIRKLRIGGVPCLLDELGQLDVPAMEIPPDRNRIEIEFAGSSFAAGDELTYRYRLTGTGADSTWRPLPQRRTLELVDVRPGTYRFAIEAVNSSGLASPQPGRITFTVLAPLWQRWWFITLALLAAGGAGYLVVRSRIRRRVELERVRTRIATDLHDDIGSSLSQIAILSEVAARSIPADAGTARETLASIALTSRELVDAMSDIVWAINPRRERLSDLVNRMRRFANDLFAEGDIRHVFRAPGSEADVPLGTELRRQTYLVFKECLHNVVRHSQATEAAIELRLRDGRLELEVGDNGRGFDPAKTAVHGQGLKSIRGRAENLGGRLTVDSHPGGGTRIQFQAPLPGTFRFKK